MGYSDVSEFKHIYGQIVTTPSCVYGRLFTWTRMVNFNALIVWKTFRHLFFDKVKSLGIWQLPIRNSEEWFGRWYEAVATGHVPWCVQYCYLIETPRDFTVEKLKAYIFVISGWSSHYRSWSAYLDSNFDGIDAVLMRKPWHYFVQITWRVISNIGWPHITPVCLGSHSQQPSGDGN